MPDYGEPLVTRWCGNQHRTFDRRGDSSAAHSLAQVPNARIVACVNACAGADNPQPGELARLRRLMARD